MVRKLLILFVTVTMAVSVVAARPRGGNPNAGRAVFSGFMQQISNAQRDAERRAKQEEADRQRREKEWQRQQQAEQRRLQKEADNRARQLEIQRKKAEADAKAKAEEEAKAKAEEERKKAEANANANDNEPKAAAATTQAGDELTLTLPGNVSLRMKKIRAGVFNMGSPGTELGRNKDENQHPVAITKDFYVGVFEVTQPQYEAIMGKNPSKFVERSHPVDNVTWNDAKEFCKRLNTTIKRLDGYKFDLPTEAQWEYACRAGTETALNNGKDNTTKIDECPNLNEVAWYGSNSGNLTHPVGQKAPNAWGLYDMHGNVAEWCLDSCKIKKESISTYTYEPKWLKAAKKMVNGEIEALEDPVCTEGEAKVNRGGGYRNGTVDCRSATRKGNGPGVPGLVIGFRLALVPIN